jgi:hypothetical protein
LLKSSAILIYNTVLILKTINGHLHVYTEHFHRFQRVTHLLLIFPSASSVTKLRQLLDGEGATPYNSALRSINMASIWFPTFRILPRTTLWFRNTRVRNLHVWVQGLCEIEPASGQSPETV